MGRNKYRKMLFGAYCAMMLTLLFGRLPDRSPLPYLERALGLLNPVPFETICHYVRLLGHHERAYVLIAVVNLFGNILMFVPLGLLMPEAYPRTARWWKVLAVTAVVITTVEITQMLTLLGTCDIDDLLLNLLGSAMGYGLFLILHKCKGSAAE